MTEKIKALFKKEFPNLIVTLILDYSKDSYVVEAVESLDKIYFNDPFYLITKKDLQIFAFMPTIDEDAFANALDNKVIYELKRGSE